MKMKRPIHADFQERLSLKDEQMGALFEDIREYILKLYPDANELLYHTHALTSVFTISDKLSDAFCMIPIYTNHLNLGFNKGTMLHDPEKLLQGTGKLIRHIAIEGKSDYRNPKVKALIQDAIAFTLADMSKPTKLFGRTISKIKK